MSCQTFWSFSKPIPKTENKRNIYGWFHQGPNVLVVLTLMTPNVESAARILEACRRYLNSIIAAWDKIRQRLKSLNVSFVDTSLMELCVSLCAGCGKTRGGKEKAFSIKKDYQDNKRANIGAVMKAANIQLRIQGGGRCALYVGHGETRGLPKPDDVIFLPPPSLIHEFWEYIRLHAQNLKRPTLWIDEGDAERTWWQNTACDLRSSAFSPLNPPLAYCFCHFYVTTHQHRGVCNNRAIPETSNLGQQSTFVMAACASDTAIIDELHFLSLSTGHAHPFSFPHFVFFSLGTLPLGVMN